MRGIALTIAAENPLLDQCVMPDVRQFCDPAMASELNRHVDAQRDEGDGNQKSGDAEQKANEKEIAKYTQDQARHRIGYKEKQPLIGAEFPELRVLACDQRQKEQQIAQRGPVLIFGDVPLVEFKVPRLHVDPSLFLGLL
jgi:hypothetical protein